MIIITAKCTFDILIGIKLESYSCILFFATANSFQFLSHKLCNIVDNAISFTNYQIMNFLKNTYTRKFTSLCGKM